MAAALMLVVCAAGGGSRAQGSWTYAIHWEHDGQLVTHFRLCVNGACDLVQAERLGGNSWRTPMPMLAAGDHRLVLEACNGSACTQGRPDLVVRFQAQTIGAPVAPPPPPAKNKDAQARGTSTGPRRSP